MIQLTREGLKIEGDPLELIAELTVILAGFYDAMSDEVSMTLPLMVRAVRKAIELAGVSASELKSAIDFDENVMKVMESYS